MHTMVSPSTLRRVRFQRSAIAALIAMCVGCGSVPSAPTAPPAPTPAAPAPGPTAGNNAPAVSVAFPAGTSCAPHGSFSCTLEVVAQGTDPDGDSLTYAWSGCATGTGAQATCTVKDPGRVTATVSADDGHGHVVTASGFGQGIVPRNNPPSAAVVFPSGAQCTPSPGRACTVTVVVQAEDPDGDTLEYVWSGCAAGVGDHATCTVSAPGPVTATVTVDDHNAHVVRASATASGSGTNRLPDVQVGYIVTPALAPGEMDVLGNISDPDDGFLCGREYCGGITSSGACGSARLECTCLAGLEAVVVRTTSTGVCSLTFEVRDRWGVVGKPTISFDVSTLTIVGHTAPVPGSTATAGSGIR